METTTVQQKLETSSSDNGELSLSSYQKNLDHAIRIVYMLDDNELTKELSSAKNCYHIFKIVGDEDNAQFYQMIYWQIKARILLVVGGF